MTDFIFLISPQQLASLGIAALVVVLGLIAAWIMAEWLMEMIENYSDGIDNWHITERRDDSDRH